jgi:hypothetical protein
MTTHLAWDTLNDLASAGATASGASRSAAQLHLAECATCREAVAAVGALDTAARTLPASIEPPDVVWAAVAATIGSRARPQAPRPPARAVVHPLPRRRVVVEARWLAAAALLLMALTAAATAWLVPREVAPRFAAAGAGAIPAAFAATERAYLDDVAELQALLDAQRPRLAPTTIAVVERALGAIDAAIAEARFALIADPPNQEIAELLAASYRQKVELLRRAAEVPATT